MMWVLCLVVTEGGLCAFSAVVEPLQLAMRLLYAALIGPVFEYMSDNLQSLSIHELLVLRHARFLDCRY